MEKGMYTALSLVMRHSPELAPNLGSTCKDMSLEQDLSSTEMRLCRSLMAVKGASERLIAKRRRTRRVVADRTLTKAMCHLLKECCPELQSLCGELSVTGARIMAPVLECMDVVVGLRAAAPSPREVEGAKTTSLGIRVTYPEEPQPWLATRSLLRSLPGATTVRIDVTRGMESVDLGDIVWAVRDGVTRLVINGDTDSLTGPHSSKVSSLELVGAHYWLSGELADWFPGLEELSCDGVLFTSPLPPKLRVIRGRILPCCEFPAPSVKELVCPEPANLEELNGIAYSFPMLESLESMISCNGTSRHILSHLNRVSSSLPSLKRLTVGSDTVIITEDAGMEELHVFCGKVVMSDSCRVRRMCLTNGASFWQSSGFTGNSWLRSLSCTLEGGFGIVREAVSKCTALERITVGLVVPNQVEQGLALLQSMCAAKGFDFCKDTGPLHSFEVAFLGGRAHVTICESPGGVPQETVVTARLVGEFRSRHWAGDGLLPETRRMSAPQWSSL